MRASLQVQQSARPSENESNRDLVHEEIARKLSRGRRNNAVRGSCRCPCAWGTYQCESWARSPGVQSDPTHQGLHCRNGLETRSHRLRVPTLETSLKKQNTEMKRGDLLYCPETNCSTNFRRTVPLPRVHTNVVTTSTPQANRPRRSHGQTTRRRFAASCRNPGQTRKRKDL